MRQRAPTTLLFVLLLGLIGQDMLVSLQLPDLRMARLLRGLHLLVLGLNLYAVLRCDRATGRWRHRPLLVSPVVLDVWAVHGAARGDMTPAWLAAVFVMTGAIAVIVLWNSHWRRRDTRR